METSTDTKFDRIHDGIEYLKKHLLTYENRHTSNTATGDGKCKYCGAGPLFDRLEICEAGTRQTRERARENIEGAQILISKLSEMSEGEQEKVLGFLDQCLQHYYM